MPFLYSFANRSLAFASVLLIAARKPLTCFIVATVTCLTPMSASVDTKFSRSFSLSLIVGSMGSILAMATMPFSTTFCRAESRSCGVGADGSMVLAVFSCGVVMVMDTTVGVCLNMSRSRVTRFDLVTISRGKSCLAKV